MRLEYSSNLILTVLQIWWSHLIKNRLMVLKYIEKNGMVAPIQIWSRFVHLIKNHLMVLKYIEKKWSGRSRFGNRNIIG